MSMLWPIFKQAISHPSKVAVVDDQRTYTYGKLLAAAMFVAEKILNTTQADRIGIMLPTSGAFPVSLLGIWLAGRTAVPLNYLLTEDELDYVIQDSGVDTIITAQVMLDFLGNDKALPKGVKSLLLEKVDFTGAPSFRWPARVQKKQLAALLYTSGTSGRPKGVMLSHQNLLADVQAIRKRIDIPDNACFLGVLPQFHSFGLTALTLLPLTMGAKIINAARFNPRAIVKLIAKHRPQVMMAVPSMYGALLSVKKATAQDFASVAVPVSGGEPLPKSVYEQLIERFNLKLLEGYGLTETSPVSNWSTPTENRYGSVGKALPTVRNLIVDDHDNPLPAGQDGHILIAGKHVMQGYYHLPKQTLEVFVQLQDPQDQQIKQFFRTGDIGHLDSDGYLFITGRHKEMLIIGGENVFPREIEEVLNLHETVNASAVVGQKDDLRGEVPIAFVELEEEQVFDAAALRNWCRAQLATYKVPREIRLVQALPRSPTGKIMRRQLPLV